VAQGKRSVIGIVRYDDLVLVGKKKSLEEGISNISNGRWHIPGGGLNCRESYESALAREIMEEAGIEIEIDRYLVSHTTPKNIYVRWYECTAKTCDIKAGSDLSDVLWVPKDSIINFFDKELVSSWPRRIARYFEQN